MPAAPFRWRLSHEACTGCAPRRHSALRHAASAPDLHTLLPLIYASPSPDAQHISPTTALAFRWGDTLNPSDASADLFAVTASKTGAHGGTVRLSDDRLTILFYPDKPFAYHETVSVVIKPGLRTTSGAITAGARYQFSTLERRVSADDVAMLTAPDGASFSLPQGIAATQAGTPYHTYPLFSNIMTSTVTTPAHNTGDGYLFVANMGIMSSADPSLLILDDHGEPVYIQRTPAGMITTDFNRQTVNGTPYLTYYVGTPIQSWGYGTYYVLDQSYALVDTWTINNGYGADPHELRLLPNGHALLLSYVPIPYDLTPYGGPADGLVMDTLVQEQDTQKNVVFEWHGIQHIPLTDTYYAYYASPVDFMHTNAIELDSDGNLLLSSRHLSEITKVDRQTGAVIWRLGGRQNQFTFANDIGFSFQHDVRRLPNGNLTLFDNGDQRQPPYSRAVEYALDESAKTVTRVWQYPADTSIYAAFMGSMQRLSNGNTLIGWGGLPLVTEVLPDGSKALELSIGGVSYRAFRNPWVGVPGEPPHAAVTYSDDPTTATIHSAWNGATEVTAYDIYAGPTDGVMSLITTALRTGFETATQLTGLPPTTCAFKIRPIQQSASPAPFSNTVYRLDQPACRALVHYVYFPSTVSEN